MDWIIKVKMITIDYKSLHETEISKYILIGTKDRKYLPTKYLLTMKRMKINFTVEKPSREHLYQFIQVNLTSNE